MFLLLIATRREHDPPGHAPPLQHGLQLRQALRGCAEQGAARPARPEVG